jgi:hypothetical protein
VRDKFIEENSIRSDVLGNSGATIDPVWNWFLDSDNVEDPNTAPNQPPDDIMHDSLYEGLEDTDMDTYSLPELPAYRKFVSSLPAYEWLVQGIRRVLFLGSPGDTQTSIRDAILKYLPSTQTVSRRKMPARHSVEFIVDWDLCSFLREQEYLVQPERAVERAITITGSAMDAQAATTAQYMSQTWPTSGVHLLDVVKRVGQQVSDAPYSRT